MTEFSLDRLDAIIASRLADPEAASYTRKLAAKGIDKCAEKFGEEAVETVIAAVQRDRAALTAEAADTLYHLLVLLNVSDLCLADVVGELEGRTQQSGLAEKASRPST
ncbi:MAG: phosphoribosyl-ATP diphosphatase [Pseudomonadota bacterium]